MSSNAFLVEVRELVLSPGHLDVALLLCRDDLVGVAQRRNHLGADGLAMVSPVSNAAEMIVVASISPTTMRAARPMRRGMLRTLSRSKTWLTHGARPPRR